MVLIFIKRRHRSNTTKVTFCIFKKIVELSYFNVLALILDINIHSLIKTLFEDILESRKRSRRIDEKQLLLYKQNIKSAWRDVCEKTCE